VSGGNLEPMKMIAVWLNAAALSLCAQDWVPKRIVAITDYVTFARYARIEGDVEIKCFLDADGSVIRAEVVSGHPILKEQARQNALLWKFQRATKGENNTVTLKYRLQGEPQDRGHTTFVVDLPKTIQITAPFAPVNP
jgi:TonB family protein